MISLLIILTVVAAKGQWKTFIGAYQTPVITYDHHNEWNLLFSVADLLDFNWGFQWITIVVYGVRVRVRSQPSIDVFCIL